LLYVADVATGRVVVFDANRLAAADDETARTALLGAVEIVPPEKQPLIRPIEDFGHDRRSGVALHSGPQARPLFADGRRRAVLARFTGCGPEMDPRCAGAGALAVGANPRGPPVQAPRPPRLGRGGLLTDPRQPPLGRDRRHSRGHDGGIFY